MNYTLVVMAAGLGSRFGSLKQITPVGPSGEFIIDYSIYDAILAGFNKVVFIIRRDFYEEFKNTIGKRLIGKIDVEYVFQELSDLPLGYACPKERSKPWGTGAAIYSARKVIDGPFAVINADDFYGREAFQILFKSVQSNENVVLGFDVLNTLSANGSVKRGVISSLDGELTGIRECQISFNNNLLLARPLSFKNAFSLSFDTLVSMNAFVFTLDVLDYIVSGFSSFLDKNIKLDSEYLLPDIINELVSLKKIKFNVKKTSSKWHGVTYKEDRDDIVLAIDSYINKGIYPKKLF